MTDELLEELWLSVERKLSLTVEQLQQRILLDPADAEAYTLLGVAFSRQDRSQEAVLAFETALRLDPGDDTAQLALGMLIVGSTDRSECGVIEVFRRD